MIGGTNSYHEREVGNAGTKIEIPCQLELLVTCIIIAQAFQKRQSCVHNHPESRECLVNSVLPIQFPDLSL
jgi:hypothetical protein